MRQQKVLQRRVSSSGRQHDCRVCAHEVPGLLPEPGEVLMGFSVREFPVADRSLGAGKDREEGKHRKGTSTSEICFRKHLEPRQKPT